MDIHPFEIAGPWKAGYVLDWHTTESVYLGDDEHGHPQFDTKRSDLGEFLYRFKYRKDKEAFPPLVHVAAQFLKGRSLKVDIIVPVPPSQANRAFQPVIVIAQGIGKLLGVPVAISAVSKVKPTPEIKNIDDYQERLSLLADAFNADQTALAGKKVLLVDDLYRSGATMAAITQVIYTHGRADAVYALALTRTRVKR
jgi:competence protein ComFC